MADEIIQQLGFDASAALDALTQMDTAFGNFQSRLNDFELRNIAGREALARDCLQPLCQPNHSLQPLGLRARKQRPVKCFPGVSPHLPLQRRDFNVR